MSNLIQVPNAKPETAEKIEFTKEQREQVTSLRSFYKGELEKMFNTRTGYLNAFMKASSGKIQSATRDMEIQANVAKLQECDRAMKRLSDLTISADTLLEHADDLIAKFPEIAKNIPDLVKALVDNKTKKLEETTHGEALLATMFCDFKRFYEVVGKIPDAPLIALA